MDTMAWFSALNAIPHFRDSSFCLKYIGKVFIWERQEIGYMLVILAPTFVAQENTKEGGFSLAKALGWRDNYLSVLEGHLISLYLTSG